jgi:hypothetical protein
MGLIDPTFTTHEVAAIASVSVRTVTKWCDDGLLVCHRLPRTGPKRGYRRITRGDLVAFLRTYGIPSSRPDLLTVALPQDAAPPEPAD